MAQKYLKLGSVLKKLLFDHNMKAIDLAREVNLPPPTIHRLITGKSTRPYKSSLLPIANYFSVNVEQLLGEEPLQNQTGHDKSLNSSVLHYLPLVPWGRLSNLETVNLNSFEKLPFIGAISNNAFASIIQDSSMSPVFSQGSVLIFDPNVVPRDRSYVLVQLDKSDQLVFRQLLIDLDQKYLKPLNPDLNRFKMRLLSNKDKIVGTLIEARQSYVGY